MRIGTGGFAKIFRMGVLLDKDSRIRGYNETQTSLTLRVPFLFQEHVNLCTDASAMMILMSWGFMPNRTLSENPRGAFQGSSIESHTDLSDKGVLTWRKSVLPKKNRLPIGEFFSMLQNVGPLGVENKGHAQVLIGVDTSANNVILHDPWKGPNKVNSFEKFSKEMVACTWLEKVGARKLSRRDAPLWTGQ